jgi:hypothetical protein
MCRHTQDSAPPHPSDYKSCYDCGHPISWHRKGENFEQQLKSLSRALEEIERLRINNAELLAALKLFGQHPKSCAKWWHHQIEGSYLKENQPCTCGLEQVIGKAEKRQ